MTPVPVGGKTKHKKYLYQIRTCNKQSDLEQLR